MHLVQVTNFSNHCLKYKVELLRNQKLQSRSFKCMVFREKVGCWLAYRVGEKPLVLVPLPLEYLYIKNIFMTAWISLNLWVGKAYFYCSNKPLLEEMSTTNLNFLNGQKISPPDTRNDDLWSCHQIPEMSKLSKKTISQIEYH